MTKIGQFGIGFDAVFYRTDAILYHKFGIMVIFRSGHLYSLCSPGNQDYEKISYFFNFWSKKVEFGDQSLTIKNVFQLIPPFWGVTKNTAFPISISTFFDEKIKNN